MPRCSAICSLCLAGGLPRSHFISSLPPPPPPLPLPPHSSLPPSLSPSLSCTLQFSWFRLCVFRSPTETRYRRRKRKKAGEGSAGSACDAERPACGSLRVLLSGLSLARRALRLLPRTSINHPPPVFPYPAFRLAFMTLPVICESRTAREAQTNEAPGLPRTRCPPFASFARWRVHCRRALLSSALLCTPLHCLFCLHRALYTAGGRGQSSRN